MSLFISEAEDTQLEARRVSRLESFSEKATVQSTKAAQSDVTYVLFQLNLPIVNVLNVEFMPKSALKCRFGQLFP